MAREISLSSKDPSTKCGAVIVDKDNSILSTGYNGFPRKIPDKPEDLNNREVKYRKVIHAEMNAAIFSGRKDLSGCTLYTYPFMCCSRCAAHMIQWGISRHVAPEISEEAKPRWEKDLGYSKEIFNDAKVALAIYKEIPQYLELCKNCGHGILNNPDRYWLYCCRNCGVQSLTE